VISRYPLVQNTRRRLSQSCQLPVFGPLFWPYHTVQMVDVQCGNQTVRLLNVHLEGRHAAVRQQQAQELIDFVSQVETPTSVLMGALQAIACGATDTTAALDGQRDQAMDMVVSRLRGRFQGLSETTVHAGAQSVLVGSGLRALEARSVLADQSLPGQLSLVVRLHWTLPLVVSNGSSTHEHL
jgi:hypothetical protein